MTSLLRLSMLLLRSQNPSRSEKMTEPFKVTHASIKKPKYRGTLLRVFPILVFLLRNHTTSKMFNPFNAVKPTMYDPFSCTMAYGSPQWYDNANSSAIDEKRVIDLLQHKGELPGEANVNAMLVEAKRQAIPFAVDALMIVTNDDYSETRLNRTDLSVTEVDAIREGSWKTVSNKIFFVAIGLLTAWTLMETCGKGEIFSFGKYFQVPKGDEDSFAFPRG